MEILSTKQEVPAYDYNTGEYKPIPIHRELNEVYTDRFTYSVLQDRYTGELYKVEIPNDETKLEYSQIYFDGVIFRG